MKLKSLLGWRLRDLKLNKRQSELKESGKRRQNELKQSGRSVNRRKENRRNWPGWSD